MKVTYMISQGRFPTGIPYAGDWIRNINPKEHDVSIYSMTYEFWSLLFDEKMKEILKECDVDIKDDFDSYRLKAEEAKNKLREVNTYKEMDTYSEEIKTISDYMVYLSQMQKEYFFDLGYGIINPKANYWDSNELIKNSKTDDIYRKMAEKVFEDFEVPDVLFVQVKTELELYAALTAADVLKNKNPNIHISIADHSYENFTLNLFMEDIIEKNMFKGPFDSIIRYGNQRSEMMARMVESLKNKTLPDKYVLTLDDIKEKKELIKYDVKMPQIDVINGERVLLMRFSEQGCHWNRCAFCIHNAKHVDKKEECFNEKHVVDRLKWLGDNGYKDFMFSDEAVTKENLYKVFDEIEKENLDITWTLRTRYDKRYDTEFFRRLKKAGCMRVLFGMESFSEHTLRLMDKYEEIPTLEEVKEVVRAANDNDISIHMTLIAGFPGERVEDLKVTTDAVAEIVDEIKGTGFTLNRFGLLKGSKVYNNPDKYKEIDIKYGNMELQYWAEYDYTDENYSKEEMNQLADSAYKNIINKKGLGHLLEGKRNKDALSMYMGTVHSFVEKKYRKK